MSEFHSFASGSKAIWSIEAGSLRRRVKHSAGAAGTGTHTERIQENRPEPVKRLSRREIKAVQTISGRSVIVLAPSSAADGLRQAICRTGERLSAVEFANDSEAYLQRMLEIAHNIFQVERQHDYEPPLRPMLVVQEQDRSISI